MKKETIIAVFFGIIFGALVAVVILAKNKEFQFNRTNTIVPTEKASKIAKNNLNHKILEVFEPKDGSVFSTKTISIKGSTEKGSLIMVQSAAKDTVLKNETDDFSLNFPLAYGENVIKLTAYSKDSNVRPQQKEFHVYYLEGEL